MIVCGKLRFSPLLGCILVLFSSPAVLAQTGNSRGPHVRDELFIVEKPRVLVLHSYHHGFTWTDNVSKGIDSVFSEYADVIEVCYEFMDVKRRYSPEYLSFFGGYLRRKYEGRAPNLIICSDDHALQFLTESGSDFYPDIPVVFCAVNGYHPEVLQKRKNITGIIETIDIRSTLDIALELHPHTKRVITVTDKTLTGMNLKTSAEAVYSNYEEDVDFIFLEHLTVDQLIEEINVLGEDAIVLAFLFSRDEKGRVFSHEVNLSLLAEGIHVPIYSVWEFYLGYGIVGGMLTRGSAHGREAARIALELLTGKSTDEFIVHSKPINRFMFDYTYLSKYGISPDRLPGQAVIINEPFNVYEEYKGEIWVFLSGLLLLLIIILFLIMNIRKRRAAELGVKASLKEKELLIKDIHHRVKNNMAIVASMINLGNYQINALQKRDSRRISDILGNIVSRVRILSQIYNFLYKIDESVRTVHSYYFFNELLALLQEAYRQDKQISFDQSIDEDEIDIAQAIPFGLLINEIVTNSYKHAFKGMDFGTIRFVYSAQNGRRMLIIGDNGCGLEDTDLNSEAMNSLGFTLIQTLVSQINGTLEVDGKNGCEIRISIPGSQ